MTTPHRHPFFESAGRALLISHAGDTASGAPSGSLSAYRSAHRLGFRVFQVDVVAVAGDRLLSKHAVFGRMRRWEHGSFDDVRADAGDDVPTLDELAAEFPGARWNIEVKSARCEQPLTAFIDSFDDRTRLCVSAPFHTRLLRRLRARFPDLATNASLGEGALIGIELPPWRRSRANGVQLIRFLALGPIVRHNLRRDRVVQAWTVNDPDLVPRLVERGVSGLVVDDYDAIDEAVAATPFRTPD